VRIPTLHLNGSSADALKEQLLDVANALRVAMRAMEAAGPNARDYYPQGEQAYPEARLEHERRLKQILGVRDWYDQILEGLQEQIDARDARRTR
jgi:hypothetical protein